MIKYEVEDGQEEFADIDVKGSGVNVLVQSVNLIASIAYMSELNFGKDVAINYLNLVITALIDTLKDEYGKTYRR